MPTKHGTTAARCLGALLLWLASGQQVSAAEYLDQDSPAPESVGELRNAFDQAFLQRLRTRRPLVEGLRKLLEARGPFWRDSRLAFHFRTYSFDRRNSATDRREAWAAGGRLAWESGWWHDLGVDAAYYYSGKVDAPGDSGDTGLLEPGQHTITALGEANLRYRVTSTPLAGSTVRLYRQVLKLPYVNKHDIRMLPATHEGYTIAREDPSLDYIVGHLTKFKDYDSEEFVHMSEAAGAADSGEGLTLAGARLPLGRDFSVGAINYYGWDAFNTFFTEVAYRKKLADDVSLHLSGQFTDQRSVGDELTGDFSTQQAAVQAAFDWQGSIVRIAASVTGDDADIRSPWGGKPSYLSLQRLDFDRAGEKAFLLGLSYNNDYFASLGLSSFISIAHGTGAREPDSGADLPDNSEFDITVDYKPPEGMLEGLWLRARAAFVDIEDDGRNWRDIRDYRLILNYSIPLL